MEKNTLEKTLDMAGSAMKIAANLSEAKKDIPKAKETPVHQQDDNSNRATTGSQSVVVAVEKGSKKKEPKPVEQHIHTFPENRALTSEECELDLKKAQMEYELKKSEQQYAMKLEERNYQHQLEQEKKAERKGKIRKAIVGILAAVGITAVGYSFYADYRDRKKVPALPEASTVKAEGEVK